tara:strand:- start:77 stop:382 length:306 start_codon:yes stop_codon:yes gene_type:complete
LLPERTCPCWNEDGEPRRDPSQHWLLRRRAPQRSEEDSLWGNIDEKRRGEKKKVEKAVTLKAINLQVPRGYASAILFIVASDESLEVIRRAGKVVNELLGC